MNTLKLTFAAFMELVHPDDRRNLEGKAIRDYIENHHNSRIL